MKKCLKATQTLYSLKTICRRQFKTTGKFCWKLLVYYPEYFKVFIHFSDTFLNKHKSELLKETVLILKNKILICDSFEKLMIAAKKLTSTSILVFPIFMKARFFCTYPLVPLPLAVASPIPLYMLSHSERPDHNENQ